MADIASKTMAGKRLVSMWICSLDESEAQLWYPSVMNAASADDLIDWLEFVTSVLKSRREKHRRAEPEADPAVGQPPNFPT